GPPRGDDRLLRARVQHLLRPPAHGAAPAAQGRGARGHRALLPGQGSQRKTAPSPRYVGAVPTISSPCTSTYRLKCSAGSPALAWRNHTVSPTRSDSAAGPTTGVCTSPAASCGA